MKEEKFCLAGNFTWEWSHRNWRNLGNFVYWKWAIELLLDKNVFFNTSKIWYLIIVSLNEWKIY